MAADYVLANPNGISCQGCGFINTSRSSLVVGNPLVENGLLQGYSTGQPQYPEPQRYPERRRRAGPDRTEDRQPR